MKTIGKQNGRRVLLRLLCLLLAALLSGACAPRAETAPTDGETNVIDDKYRNWYEVFVYSFADSDGDRYGDLNGLTGKLDYIASLGCNGIWLMPIMPSPSYHKYDVTDYYDIDPLYGTLDDFENLLAEAHARGIDVIIDLVVNHTSSEHPWFVSARTGEESPYRDYYNFTDEPQPGYNRAGDSYYESRFVATMPDLNLDNPAVRDEIEKIMRFWLELGVDGFRLDAVTSYYTGNPAKNIAFLSWLGDTARAIAPDCYIVGEAWEDLYTLETYAESRIDAFFCFPVSQREGYIAQILGGNVRQPGTSYGRVTLLLEEKFADTIPAPFLGNHDTPRAASFLGAADPARLKMAAGLLAMMRGGVFLYYGEEIGMAGTDNDPNKRIGMLWTTRAETTLCPPGTTVAEYPFPSVAEQEDDPGSLLNYYRHAMRLRNRNPEIARGVSEVVDCGDTDCCIIRRTYAGESILIVLNIGREARTLSLDAAALGYAALTDALVAGEGVVTLTRGRTADTLALPPYAIAVLR